MKIGNVDLDKEVLIIAEVGNNHEGDIELAKKMIRLGAKAGVQAIKFQTIIPEKLVSSDQIDRLNQLRKYQFKYEQYIELKKICDNEGVIFLSTPFDLETVDFLNDLVPAFKISSGDNTFFPLLEKVAATGKPILLSTGITTINEIRNSINTIENIWAHKGVNNGELALLHCNVSYPTPNEDVNLKSIELLKEFGYTVGFSDHSLGIDAAVYSIAFGARIVEKHFTCDKKRTNFRDHQLSADYKDMKKIVAQIKLFDILSGKSFKDITKSERVNISTVRRSVAAARNLKKGTVIEKDDLIWVRPGTGIEPGEENKILKQRLKKDYQFGEIFNLNDLERA